MRKVFTVLLVSVLGVFSLFAVIQYMLKSSDAYEVAIEFINTNHEISEQCGEFVGAEPFVLGTVSQRRRDGVSTGTAELRMEFEAENGKYMIDILLLQSDGVWKTEKYSLFKK